MYVFYMYQNEPQAITAAGLYDSKLTWILTGQAKKGQDQFFFQNGVSICTRVSALFANINKFYRNGTGQERVVRV